MRTGDTSASERRRIQTRPPDVLITTPESLYLMLTSQAREILRSVRWVIVDEIHAMAGFQARRAPRALARTPRGARARAPAAHRPVRHPATARGDRAVPRRPDLERAASRDDRRRRAPQADGGRSRRAGRGHGGPVGDLRDSAADAGDARARHPRDRAATGVDLAGDPPAGARADPGAPFDDRVRQRPPPGRAPRGPSQRARRRGARASPPRLDRARTAAPDRGRSSSAEP